MDLKTLFQTAAAILGSVFVSAGVLYALSTWLGKVWANRILEQDRARYQRELEAVLQRLKTASEKELFVHRLQFEKEFDIYFKLWGKLHDLRNAAQVLRPTVGFITNTDEYEEERKKTLLKDLATAYEEVRKIVYDYRPFYAPDIYEAADKILCTAWKEGRQFARQSPDMEAYWENAEKNVAEIDKLCEEICGAIRKRIWQ